MAACLPLAPQRHQLRQRQRAAGARRACRGAGEARRNAACRGYGL